MSTDKKKGYYIAAILLVGAGIAGWQMVAPEPTSIPVVTTDPLPPSGPIASTTPPVTEEPKPQEPIIVPLPKEPVPDNCNPNYSGCLRADASDYDCASGSGNGPYYTGKVRVIGYDQYDLDRDNDGWGCE